MPGFAIYTAKASHIDMCNQLVEPIRWKLLKAGFETAEEAGRFSAQHSLDNWAEMYTPAYPHRLIYSIKPE
ncbi:MAG: hypothetical protein RL268_299 [Pseudomonadota bacterium]|jgi:hypothetical protein